MSDEDVAGFHALPGELFADVGPDGRLVWANAATADALGEAVGELEGRSLAALVHPDDLAGVVELFCSSWTIAGPSGAESRWRHRDGTWRWLDWTVDRSAESTLAHGAARDVTDRHLTRAARRSERGRLQAIIDHSSSAIFVKDLQARYVLVNDAFLEPLGLKSEDVIGRTARQIWPDADFDDGSDALVGVETQTRDDVVELADGPHTMMTVRFSLRDAGDRIVGLAGIATDVTDRTRAEAALAERERLLETIIQASPDIVTILDHTGRVREVSQASERILGYAVDDPMHDELVGLVHPDDIATIHREYARLLTLETSRLELRFRARHAEGHWVTLDSRAQTIVGEDGRAVGALVMSRDVSEDLVFEAELLTAVGVAERASRAKSEFLSRMSHELRTPLNSVLGFAQLLDMDDLSEQQEKAVDHILRAGRHLLNLIDEVLDIARIEAGHLDLSVEPVLVLDVLGDAVDLTQPLAEHRQVALVVDTSRCRAETYALADRQRLLQVLLNLLSNATKYSHRADRVVVAVAPNDDGRVRISVVDTGPGIRPEDLDRVFEPFDRLGAERSGVEGTGVGLTLSKHLVERMGGEIVVESTPAVGSTFSVLLPLTAAPAELEDLAPASRETPALHGAMRILHVEDNLANLALVEQILARHQEIELIAATMGGVALELARRHKPDVILLDLHLPDMSGIDVLGRLRADPSTTSIPVVVVSADATPDRMARLDTTSVAAYLTKPIDVRELLRVIEAVAPHAELGGAAVSTDGGPDAAAGSDGDEGR
ncbi:MAG TPA: PAS domain S-box protein [Acidimicrobiales bacterium]|nr:PAS domain S-box protein [Acidimicrobiales bacterium]